ncbi:MAG: hypothetical protein P1V97_38820 [Planctomycetota bacterium]|nr:hypothetical protein [Planctomycetota bacterium]
MSLKSSFLSLFLLLLCTQAATAQSFNAGARSLGVGGSFQALADDATAVFWNPAGGARIGTQIHGTVGSYPRIDEEGDKDNEPVPGPAFVGATVPISEGGALIGGYLSPFVNDRRYEIRQNLPGNLSFQELQVSQFFNRLSAGYAHSFQLTEEGTGYFPYIAVGATFDLSITSLDGDSFDSAGIRSRINAREVAPGFTAGILITVVDRSKFELRIGGAYHHSGDFRLRDKGFDFVQENSQASRLYDWPMIAGGGVAIRCLETKSLVFVADYQFVRWKKANRNLEDSHNFSAGAEYGYQYSKTSQIIFRGGARRIAEPSRDDPLSMGIDDHIFNTTAGLGFVYQPRAEAFYAVDGSVEFGDTFNFALSLTLGF